MTGTSPLSVHHAHGIVMGGPWQICHVPEAGIRPEDVAATALRALQLVDQQMSHYKADSDLMRLNRAALETWVSIPASMAEVMLKAQQISAFTAGALDITLGDAVNAWGFGPAAVPETPPVIPVPDSTQVPAYTLREAPPAVQKHHPVSFNLCALAKGYAVDNAAKAVAALGIKHFLIEAAGEIYAQGKRPDDSAWQIGLELPVPGKSLIYGQIALDGCAVATSGSYRKFNEIAAQQYPHTINPRTAAPIVSDLLSVSVIDPCCMQADGMATALFIQGAEAGSAFAQQHDLAALFLVRTQEGIAEIRSPAWLQHIGHSG